MAGRDADSRDRSLGDQGLLQSKGSPAGAPEKGDAMSEHMNAEKAEKTLVDDVIREGALENETHSMEASIKPNYDVEGSYGDPAVAEAVDGAEDRVVEENLTVGTDENGNRYAEVSESVTGEE